MLPSDPLTAMNLLETPESPRDSYTSEQPKQVGSGKLQHEARGGFCGAFATRLHPIVTISLATCVHPLTPVVAICHATSTPQDLFVKEPPLMPPHLTQCVLTQAASFNDILLTAPPSHVVLNHL